MAKCGFESPADAETDELVLLEWWATGCGPCFAKFPELKELYASYQDAEFQAITVNVAETYEEWY